MNKFIIFFFVMVISGLMGKGYQASAQDGNSDTDLDERVSAFLKSQQTNWKDMNIPESDGKALYDLIVRHGYKQALEIGTSTGHSGIWMAWALSKTGGKLITIEIDKERHRTAKENFKKAGLSQFIDDRFGDAHEIVPTLAGPFDFVFSDADKEWYTNYFKSLAHKLSIGGCFTAHNVLNGYGGTQEFLDYVKHQSGFETTILKSSRSGISVSYKRK